jgi:hypothetical protein
VEIRSLETTDRAWVESFVRERWGTPTVAARGRVQRPGELPGFVALEEDEPIGLLTFAIDGSRLGGVGGRTSRAGSAAVVPSTARNRCRPRTATIVRAAEDADSGVRPSSPVRMAARKAETSPSCTWAGAVRPSPPKKAA